MSIGDRDGFRDSGRVRDGDRNGFSRAAGDEGEEKAQGFRDRDRGRDIAGDSYRDRGKERENVRNSDRDRRGGNRAFGGDREQTSGSPVNRLRRSNDDEGDNLKKGIYDIERVPISRNRGRAHDDDERKPLSRDRGRDYDDDSRRPVSRDRGREYDDDERRPMSRDRGRDYDDDSRRPVSRERGRDHDDYSRRPVSRDRGRDYDDDSRRPLSRDRGRGYDDDGRMQLGRGRARGQGVGDDEQRSMGRDNRGREYYNDGDRRPMGSDRGGGGRGRGGRGRGDDSGKPAAPPLYSIHRATVRSVRPFGIFVQMEGYRNDGLVHLSQVSDHEVTNRDDSEEAKVKALSSVADEGEQVWVKVVSVQVEEGGKTKIGCSMKYVNQGNGEDLDPNNIQAEKNQSRPSWKEPQKFKLEAVYNVQCERCGGHGHLKKECYSSGEKAYKLLSDDEDTNLAVQNATKGDGRMPGMSAKPPKPPSGISSHLLATGSVGRGRAVVQPAWMKHGIGVGGPAPPAVVEEQKKDTSLPDIPTTVEEAYAVIARLKEEKQRRKEKRDKRHSSKDDKKDKREKKDKHRKRHRDSEDHKERHKSRRKRRDKHSEVDTDSDDYKERKKHRHEDDYKKSKKHHDDEESDEDDRKDRKKYRDQADHKERQKHRDDDGYKKSDQNRDDKLDEENHRSLNKNRGEDSQLHRSTLDERCATEDHEVSR